MKKALLVIDMQKGCFTSETPRHDTAGVIDRINALADLMRACGHPVIFIQHDGTKENTFHPGSSEWELLSALAVQQTDLIISKTANSPFYRTKLAESLKALGVTELLITGCATDFCVEATIQSALVNDFSVTVIKNGHTTGNRPHLSAEQVIKHYNWTWQNMIPTNGSIQVVEFEEVIRTTPQRCL